MTTTIIRHQLEKYLLGNLHDHQFNGFFTALDGDNEIICDDKQLEDQALGIISLCQLGPEQEIIEAVRNLTGIFSKLKDQEYAGCIELTDRFWQPHGPGWVRTPAVQLIAAWSMLEAGALLKQDELLAEGYRILDAVISYSIKRGFPRRLDRNWEEITDYRRDLKTVSCALLTLQKAYTLSKNEAYLEAIKEAANELRAFMDGEFGGAYDMLAENGKPWKSAGKQTHSQSLAVYAILKTHDLLADDSFITYAENMITFILKHMPHPTLGGYWNKANIDGVVRVEALHAYYNNDFSPFPVKLVSDQGLLLLAITKLQTCTGVKYDHVIKHLAQEVYKFIDRTNNGIFTGQGNFFSTPYDPTAPLTRQIMVPPHTPGSFYAGNTAYVPLHQKQTKTQALILFALTLAKEDHVDIFELVEAPKLTNTQLKPTPIKFDLSTIATPIHELKLDIPKYLQWSASTKAGPAYGLTAYRSPLGFRSDRSNQNFSGMHVLSDLAILGLEAEGVELMLGSMFSSGNPDGGFGEQPSHPSEVFTTYCVVVSAFLLKAELPNKSKVLGYLKSCQNPDGGFGNAPGFPSDIWHTNLAVLSLHVLGSEPNDPQACIDYCVACQNEDGSYSIQPDSVGDTFSVFRAVSSLVALGKLPPNTEKTIKWLQDCQTETGGFRYKPSVTDTVSFVGSYHAIAALYILGELPVNVEACKQWIADHQGPDGGFSRIEGTPSDTTDEGFISVQASYMLERALNPYWVVIVT